MAISASDWLQWAIAFGVYPPDTAQGSVTSVDTGTGLTGGPITGSGIISFVAIAPQSFWANATDSSAVPTVQSLTAFTPSTLTAGEIYVGNASNIATGVAMSGDVAISDAGVTTVGSIGGHAVSLASTFTVTGAHPLTFTVTNTTNATLPAGSITLVTSTGTGATGVWSGITGLGAQSQALDMNSQLINFVANPVSAGDAVNLQTLQTYSQGLNPLEGVYSASTANLTGYTYLNGVLTAPSNGVFTQDGVSPAVGARWLYKDDSNGSGAYNGVYNITTSSAGAPAVLTRSADYNSAADISPGDLIAVANGTVNGQSTWIQTATVVTLGVDPLSFSLFFSPANYVSSSLSAARIYVGNASNIATGVTMSGDVSISNAGVTTVNSINSQAFGTGVVTALGQTVSGSGSMALTDSPTFVTPILGVASATSLAFSSTSGIIGTTTNNSAAAGSVGEFVSSVVPYDSPVSLTNSMDADVTSISLTAGDWDVWGNVTFIPDSSTTIVIMYDWLSSTSATLPDPSLTSSIGYPSATAVNNNIGFCAPSRRFSFSGTTTVYLSAYAAFLVSTMTACGGIYARRVR